MVDERLVLQAEEHVGADLMFEVSNLVLAVGPHCEARGIGPFLVALGGVLRVIEASLVIIGRMHAALLISAPYIGLARSVLLIVIISRPSLRMRHILRSPVVILITCRV